MVIAILDEVEVFDQEIAPAGKIFQEGGDLLPGLLLDLPAPRFEAGLSPAAF